MNMKINLTTLSYVMLIIAIISMSSIMATSQSSRPGDSPKKISGIVKDTSGETLVGATILEEGTTNGVVTDLSGNFTISVKSKARLLIQYVGYEKITVDVGEKKFF